MASDPTTFANPAIDSPAIRVAGADLLSLALMDARNHSLYLLGAFEKAMESAQFVLQRRPEVVPPHWVLGHMGWFQEFWIGRNLHRNVGSRQTYDEGGARLASIDPHADRWWSDLPWAARWDLDLPTPEGLRGYLMETLESTLDLLNQTPDEDDALYFYRLALLHEDWHAEALVSMAQVLGVSLALPMGALYSTRPAMLVPATRWMMGSSGRGFAFDNELPAHEVAVPEFEIDAQPVTWAQYVEFVADGGYDRSELWHPAGWQWLSECGAAAEGRRAPRYVDQIGVSSGAVLQTRFGVTQRVAGAQSAMHVTWWEADAWARWAGRRLVSEVEWEIAAATASSRGFRWGDVWEWTSNRFAPYPGFLPGPCQDFSTPRFEGHKALRGGSFATRARLKSPRMRGFAEPHRDDLFVGFRTCAI